MIAGVIGAGILCQWVAWRIKIPSILPLLLTGFLLGPITGILHPQDSLGALFFPLVSFAVAIILFEGALTLNWHELRNVGSTVRNLLSIGSLVTWLGGALAAKYILQLNWNLALLFGALIIVTGPTVIAPLLRNVRPSANVSSTLKWEGILIDPIGATVAVLVFEFIAAEVAGHGSFNEVVIGFLLIAVVGTIEGLVGGFLIEYMLKRYLVPDYLRDVTILAIVLVVFAMSNFLAAESGLLAVTVMGVFLANRDLKQLREIWFFNERLSILLISTLFVLLAANMSLDDFALLDWRAFIVLLVVLFVLRPIGAQLSTLGSPLTRNERLLLSWIAPRGIVAAAISSLFAFELVALGYAEARIIAPLTFMVIVGTVLLQGSTARWFAKQLGVREADPQGVLIMGCNALGRGLARALAEEGFIVRMVDTNWDRVRTARMDGIDVYHGNILSEFTESQLDLGGIGYLLALTRNDAANALACQHLSEELGSSHVYQLPPASTERGSDKAPSAGQSGRIIGELDETYAVIMHQLEEEGATIKKTLLTEQFTYADFQDYYSGVHVPLLAFRDEHIVVNTVGNPLAPGPGWTLVSILEEIPTKNELNMAPVLAGS